MPTRAVIVSAILFAASLAALVTAADPGKKSQAGEICGGIAGLECEDGLWCDLQSPACKGNDLAGVCVKVPEVCSQDYNPVCGCDGKSYSNDCHRQMKKVRKNYDGKCIKKK